MEQYHHDRVLYLIDNHRHHLNLLSLATAKCKFHGVTHDGNSSIAAERSLEAAIKESHAWATEYYQESRAAAAAVTTAVTPVTGTRAADADARVIVAENSSTGDDDQVSANGGASAAIGFIVAEDSLADNGVQAGAYDDAKDQHGPSSMTSSEFRNASTIMEDKHPGYCA
ncbi:hypothetical protein BG015_000498 [Linnemannia schmuckeri]|uniref:Uncharacterized protein n=1 Tax=Linnemannia schmuckeri TaxID=64567 RepID=A0A9P5VE67_9FUNG|nr:hypothetical protein BG015_000498 [Linnemannia schmuckeri]